MRKERADRLRRQALQQFRDLMGRTVFYGFSHQQFTDEVNEIRKIIKTCPVSVASYFDGYRQAVIERWYETELAYCHRAPCGILYSAHKGAIAAGIAKDVDAIYKADRGKDIPTWESAHYWLTASKREAEHGRQPRAF